MATGRFGSPAKNMNKGYGPAKTSSPAKQTKEGTKPLTALQQARKDAAAAQVSNQVANIVRNTAGTNKETAKLKRKTARDNSGAERKTKNAAKTQARVDERKKSGKTRVGKVIDKIKEAVSPAKQAKITDAMYKKRDMKLYGDLDKAEFDTEANRQINVRNKKFKNATEMSKANSGGKQTKTDYSGGQTKDGSCSREDDACNTKGQSIRKSDIGYDVPKTKMKSRTKKVTTLKAGGRLEGGKEVKNKKAALPTAKPIKAKAIKVTKKVAEAKPTRSQKIRAKGEAALASGKTDKAQRLRRRMDRTEAREEKRAGRKEARAGRKEARAAKKNKMAMTKSKVDKKAKPVKKKAMDSSRMEN